MSKTAFGPSPTPSPAPRRKRRTSLAARGEPMVWLTGAAAAMAILMIVGLLVIVGYFGFTTFWPQPVYQVELNSGQGRVVGEVFRSEQYTVIESPDGKMLAEEPEEPVEGEAAAKARGAGDQPDTATDDAASGNPKPGESAEIGESSDVPEAANQSTEEALAVPDDIEQVEVKKRRVLYRTGNGDTSDAKFVWIKDDDVAEITTPPWVLIVERNTTSHAVGNLVAIDIDGELTEGAEAAWAKFNDIFPTVQDLVDDYDYVAEHEIGRLSDQQRDLELDIVAAGLDVKDAELALRRARSSEDASQISQAEQSLANANKHLERETERVEAAIAKLADERNEFQRELAEINEKIEKYRIFIETSDGQIVPAERNGRTATVSAGDALTSEQRELVTTVRLRGDLRPAGPDDTPMGTGQLTDFESKQVATSSIEADLLDAEGNVLGTVVIPPRSTVMVADGQAIEASSILAEAPRPMLLGQIVRAYPPNQLGFGGKVKVYASRWWEFLTSEPRGTGEQGGVWPAIVGTILLTFIMIIFVVPIGVVAAIYLREYAKQGPLVSLIRISVNNLAGVPSIVYGIFGFGFFCYGVGAWIDDGAQGAGMPALTVPTWLLYLLLTVIISCVAIALGSLATRKEKGAATDDTKLPMVFRLFAGIAWATAAIITLYVLLAQIPREIFDGFYTVETAANQSRYKGGALIWASLTLALLTLPLVIVATEEALAAVPRSMREGSYACGASKWQTIHRIVLPRALPGVMTGMILALARGAGEVAPIMLVGAVKVAAELPITGEAPFVQLDNSFLHLGYQIFELGFKSTDAEAARPLVYTTTLLLIGIVVILNVAAIGIRSRLRRAYAGGQF